MTPASGLRIGDTDREATAAALREHFAQGRLTIEEFQDRLAAVFAAKTDRDLAHICADLPHVAAPSPGRTVSPAPGSSESGYRRRVRGPTVLAGFIMVVLALVLVAFVLPVALMASAISRALLFLVAIVLFGRRGVLRRFRRWLPRNRRRWPF